MPGHGAADGPEIPAQEAAHGGAGRRKATLGREGASARATGETPGEGLEPLLRGARKEQP